MRSGRAVALLLLLVAACTAEREASTAPPFGPATTASDGASAAPSETPTIAVVGDSITVGSEIELREQLGALDVEIMAIDAEGGRRMTADGASGSGVDAVSALASADAPDLWVIALGTNDVGAYDGAEGYAPVIDELVDEVPADAPLVWVDVYIESSPEASAEFNATLREALDARGQATVVDWASLAEEDGVLRDGIHPSGFGIEQFAEMVSAAVAQWVG